MSNAAVCFLSDDDAPPLLRTSELAVAIRAEARKQGIPANHPSLDRLLARRLRALLESGALRHTRVRSRYYVDPADVPAALRLLGLTDTIHTP